MTLSPFIKEHFIKVLLVNTTAYPVIGGVENSLIYIARELIKLNHDVSILCLKVSPHDPDYIKHDGISIYRCDFSFSRWAPKIQKHKIEAAKKGFGIICHSFKPDVVWARSSAMGLGIIEANHNNIPVIGILPTIANMNCNGLYFNTKGNHPLKRLRLFITGILMYRLELKMERQFLEQCIPVVFSNMMKLQIKKCLGSLSEKVHVISPGVDSDFFSPSNGKYLENKVTQNYGISPTPDEPWILYVGRLSIAKNISILIDALKYVKSNARLVIVGDGKEKNNLINYAQKINVYDRIHFIESQNDLLPAFYTMSHVTVLPTVYESFGQVYLESMACGTPVIGFSGNKNKILTATEEIIINNETGIIVKKISSKALSNAINALLNLSVNDYDHMSANAIRHVHNKYSWYQFVCSLLKLSTNNSRL